MKKDYKKTVSMKDIENLKDQLSFSQKKYQEKWKRYIPPLDVLFDRWKNGENYGFGENQIFLVCHILLEMLRLVKIVT